MAAANGRADTVGVPIQLGDFFPERRQVVLNGQKYNAWVATNKRYPRTIMARLDKEARIYNRIVAPLLEVRGPEDVLTAERIQAMDDQPEAWEHYITECILLLVPGVMESELELVDLSVLEGLLRDLGYFREVAPDGTGSTKEELPPLTGDTAPDDSPISTLDTTPISS